MSREIKKTKIVCTLGPASTDEAIIKKMLQAGMNVARLNFSHGSHEGHKQTIEKFRRVRDELGIPAAVLLDTKGPEIRTGMLDIDKTEKIQLEDGQKFILVNEDIIGRIQSYPQEKTNTEI